MFGRTFLPVFTMAIVIQLFALGPLELSRAGDSVYGRNGEVYVMIGEGLRMGVYAHQKIDESGNRVPVKPDGVKLFGDITKMDNYQAIAVDQFRNIYVLAGKYDPGLQDIKTVQPPGELYVPVDPPHGCGIAGVGRDAGNKVYYDVLNYVSKNGGADIRHLHSPGEPFWRETVSWSRRDRPFISDWHPRAGTYGSGPSRATFLDEARTPPATTSGYNFITGVSDAYNTNYASTCPGASAGKIRRMPEDVWYPGDYKAWNDIQDVGDHNGMRKAKMWIHHDFKIQRISLWVSHYVGSVPPGVILPSGMSPGVVQDVFEKVFNTTNMKYTFMCHSGCESSHTGDSKDTDSGITTEYKLGFTTTGAGRRYVYSSLPAPKIKKGLIQLVAGNTFGIPQGDSYDYNSLDRSQPLVPQTCNIGAATKNSSEDYVYTAPVTYGGWDVIGFTVADQWDGTGGVRYMLLQSGSSADKRFDPAKAKKLKWNKMNGYVPASGDPVKDGEVVLPNDVKAIAGDGSGSVYYLTDPRPVFDGASVSDSFLSPDSSPTNLKPLASPGRPDGPMTQDGKRVWKWYRKFSARAATELFQVEYYTKTQTKLNDFTVGVQSAMALETFSDAGGANLISRGQPMPIPPVVGDIKLALATINLAGPPVGNDERMCVDIDPLNAAPETIKDVTASTRDGGAVGDITVPGPGGRARPRGDEIAEDTQYRCRMENAPPKFSNDLVKKNIISGTALKDENDNGYKGGFDYAIRPGTACYYWRVEMVEPMKKTLVPDSALTKVTSIPAEWPGSPGVDLADGTWYSSRGANAGAEPGRENSDEPEAAPDFAFTPKEPGVYKISLAASAKKWNYSVLGYPSYIIDRDNVPGCKDRSTHYLFCDNGEGGGIAGNGVKDGGETYVAERYVVAVAQKTVQDDYVRDISITGPAAVNENEPKIWTASAKVRFVRSFNHENLQGVQPNGRQLMETYNGIGVWDYPATAVADWGLPAAFDGVGENYVTGAPGWPANGRKSGASILADSKLRNFGEIPPGGRLIAPTPELVGVNAPIYGTSPNFALWVAGAGTNANPGVALNKADRGAIEYEWYLAAQNATTSPPTFVGARIDGATTATDERRCPDILIAKGRLSDEGVFAGDNSRNAVQWTPGNYKSSDRYYNVKVNLRYAFDMPLDPGYYYLYVKFKYPRVKWQGRSPKKDKQGNFIGSTGAIVASEADAAFAYYDLVDDGAGASSYCPENWAAINTNVSEPSGFKIMVKDLQPPQAYFICPDRSLNPDPAAALNSAAPPGGVIFKGATTGDAFPGNIVYKVCDNNPNLGVSSSLMAKVGPSASSLAWKENRATETEDVAVAFDRAKVRSALENTINPVADARRPGQIQDAKIIPVNAYPGYGVNAPFRQAIFKIADPKAAFDRSSIPYDMTGDLPMYAAGSDGSGNKMSDFNKSGTYNELLAMVNDSKDETKVNLKKFPKAPACIALLDNDAPSMRFTALRARDGVVREYVITGTGAASAGTGRPAAHASNYDDLDWDPSAPDRLCVLSRGKFEAAVRDLDLNGGPANLPGQNNPVFPQAIMPYDGAKCVALGRAARSSPGGEVKVEPDASAGESFVLKFNGRNVAISPIYKDFCPLELNVFDFGGILSGGGRDLELVENSRTRLTISIVDNVDGIITPALTLATATVLDGDCLVDTKDLGDAQTLIDVMGGWRAKGTLLETYGIFRNPTPAGNVPFMVLVGRDKSGNSTVVNLPVKILHTFMRNEVIDVETKRSE